MKDEVTTVGTGDGRAIGNVGYGQFSATCVLRYRLPARNLSSVVDEGEGSQGGSGKMNEFENAPPIPDSVRQP